MVGTKPTERTPDARTTAVTGGLEDVEHRRRDGARRVAPLGLASVVDGITFGVLATSAGFGALPAVVMSATTFAGSAQFAVVSLVGAGSGALAAITTAIFLNSRSLLMGISVAPALTGGPLRRFMAAQLVVDESWAVGQIGRGRWDRRLVVGAGLVMYACWLSGTCLGLAGAELIGDPRRLGLDAAFVALFLALLVAQVRDRRTLLAALGGGAVAAALVPISPPGVPILAASAVALAGWRWR